MIASGSKQQMAPMGAVCVAAVNIGPVQAREQFKSNGHALMFADEVGRTDACALLLAEVDFKWLMAGQGQWIDLVRFRCDSSYATGLIRLALASNSLPLRECAALLQTAPK